jgi:hypothetical protein
MKPDDSTPMKMDLGHEIRRLLSIYQEQEGVNASSAVRDLLTEVVHFCDEHQMDPDARFDAAIEIACQETRKIRTAPMERRS